MSYEHLPPGIRDPLIEAALRGYPEFRKPPPPRFKLQRVLNAMAAGMPPTGLEAELIDGERLRTPGHVPLAGVPIPWACLAESRALTATGSGASGGYAAGLDTLPSVQALRSSSHFIGRGATVVEEMVHPAAVVPRVKEGASLVCWGSEIEAETPQDMAVAQLSLVARRMSIVCDVSAQLLKQTAADAALSAALLGIAGEEIDRALLGTARGTGAEAPFGLLNASSGVPNISGASFNLGAIGDMMAAATAGAADVSTMAWMIGADAADIVNTRVGTGTGDTLLQHLRATGVEIIFTKRMKADAIALVDRAAAVVGIFSALQVETSQGGYRFNAATVGMRLMAFVDVGWLNAEGSIVAVGVT